MPARVSEEGAHPRGIRYVVIERKFRDWQPIHPIILSVIDKTSEALLKRLICSFGLSICLGGDRRMTAAALSRRTEQSSLQKSLTNCGPLSEVTCDGSPCRRRSPCSVEVP